MKDGNDHQQQDPSKQEEKCDPAPLYPPERVVSREHMDVLNILVHPVWVFDIQNCCMKWANNCAVELWNASSLQDLLDRDFRTGMSEATITRLATYLVQFEQGQQMIDQWTFYPKGEAKTVKIVASGIRLSADESKPSMLVEAFPLLKGDLDAETLRGVEMLRHLPVPVCQFDMTGKIMFQNPEATVYRGEDGEDESSDSQGTTPQDSPSSQNSVNTNDFCDRFVERKVGEEALHKMQRKKDHGDEITMNFQANLRTRLGTRWCAILLRRTTDPVTGQSVILYSSKDMTDAITARKEREASVKKSEFLAIMAHEIRTPLHQVTGFIDLLDQTDLNKEQRAFVKLLKSSAQGLMTVINDVLDYSKLEAGKMKIESIPYEPLSVLEGCLAAVRASCEEKNLYLTMDWNKKIPFKVIGDPNRLRQILLNILSNAVKFTTNGGIHVQALLTSLDATTTPQDTETASMIKFIVTDSGMGISKKHQGIIFNQYQQGSVSVARNFGGTGLGLSICKLLIGTMGGYIGVESEIGHGTSFWFTLPLQLPKDDGDDPVEESLDASNRSERGLHILIAEDNKVNQKLLASMLKRMGHTWDLAENGKVAIERVETTTYDVVLMDIQMPVMDGLEATRRIRSLGYSDLPILGLTASVSRSDFTELGFNDWLPKPIPMKELNNRLYRIQHQHRTTGRLTGVPEDV